MIHGLNNNYLYTAKKIITKISDGTNIFEMRGTGFFIKKGEKLIFVTNRHMIEPEYNNSRLKGFKVREFLIESYQFFDNRGYPSNHNIGKVTNFNDFIVAKNPLNDVAILADVHILGTGMTINAHIEYDMLADKDWFDLKLSVCDSIAYPGFSDWFDRKNNTPIFRMGTIASDPRFDYSINPMEMNAARIAYEGFSTGGASGSPVFAIQKGFPIGDGLVAPADFYREIKVIGINAGHFDSIQIVDVQETKTENITKRGNISWVDGDIDVMDSSCKSVASHSGISFFYKSSVIRDMIEQN